jgi:biofilm PGA synthesis N-glycosyltransferase PgaC
MDFGSFTFYLFACVSTLYVVHFGFYLVGANLYDIWQFKRHFKQRWMAAQGLSPLFHPLVSVLVPAHNEEKVVARCLESLIRSTYDRIEILVVDDASSDKTPKVVRKFIKEHKDFTIRLIRQKENTGKGGALNNALRDHAKGELAMTLDADSMVASTAITNAVSYFHDPKVVGVAAHVHIIEEHSVLGVLQKFEHMVGYRSKKAYSLFNCEFVIGGVASTYRMDILRRVGFYDTDTLTEDIGLSTKIVNQGNRANRILYGADVVAITEGVETFRALLKQRYRWKYGSLQNLVKYRRLIGRFDHNFSRMLTLYRMPMAVISELVLLTTPVVWGYVIYASLGQYSLGLILGAYLTITTYMLITLWSAESIRFTERLRMSFYAPIAYFIFYIMDLVQLVAIVRCLAHIHYLLRRKDTGSTWVSPKRVGREVAVQ